jgi:hypothetical protein
VQRHGLSYLLTHIPRIREPKLEGIKPKLPSRRSQTRANFARAHGSP